MMDVHFFTEPAGFRDHVSPYLMRHEAEHNLMFGILHTLVHAPERYEAAPLLLTVEEEGSIQGVGMMTSPYNLILSRLGRAGLVELIARELLQRGVEPPGVLASKEVAGEFARVWEGMTGHHAERVSAQRIYQLTEVQPIEGVAGGMREATAADDELLMRWATAFAEEALGSDTERQNAHRSMEMFLKRGGMYLWENGAPVSMAGAQGPTPHGIRISYVYTPPEQRQRGYASALVAALSQKMLDEGRRFCFLFTDLTNPTSNHIYQAIGYEPVGDIDMYRFLKERSG